MDQLEQNQAALRGDVEAVKENVGEMKSKIDQLTLAIQNMIARDTESSHRRTTILDWGSSRILNERKLKLLSKRLITNLPRKLSLHIFPMGHPILFTYLFHVKIM